MGEPLIPNPNRQLICRRQASSLPAGCVFALMMLETAPTPCSRTGFHMINISLWETWEWVAPAVVHATGLPVVVLQVGSIMIKSPGLAASIALWIESEAATWVGALPPTVTVTASTDCLPLPAVITSSPQRAGVVEAGPPNWTCCWMVHVGTGIVPERPGTVTVMAVSLQTPIVAGTPPILTLDTVLQVVLLAVGAVQRAPNP